MPSFEVKEWGAGRDHHLFCSLVGPVKYSSFDHFPNSLILMSHFYSQSS